MAKTKTKIREEFLFLNDLRQSGTTNMFGAAPYLEYEFELTNREARRMVSQWMEWVRENPSNREL
jgi:hypothetical protein